MSNAQQPTDSPITRSQWALVLAAAIVLHGCGLWRPLIDRHDWGSAHQAQFGRNHLRYGLAETKGRCVYSKFQRERADARWFYPDHPPMLSLSLAASMSVFGVNDVAVRIVPAATTVAAIVLTMSIGARLFGRRIGLYSGVVMLAFPIVLYFGRTGCHETLVLPFCLLAMRGYLGWSFPALFGHRPRRDAAVFAIATVLSAFAGWVALLQAGVIWLDFVAGVWKKKRRGNVASWLLVTMPAMVGTCLTALHILWTLNWQVGHLYDLFAYRSGMKQSEKLLTMDIWLVQQGLWLLRDFGAVALTVILVGFLIGLLQRLRQPSASEKKTARKLRKEQRAAETHPVRRVSQVMAWFWLLGMPGLLFVLIFRSASLIHEYWWLHFAPYLAMLVAEGLVRIGSVLSSASAPLGGIVAAGLAVGIALEAASEKSIFHHRQRLPAAAYLACQYIAENAPPDAVVYGNRQLWATRSYYEGRVRFLHPQFCWYLDRMYHYAASEREIRAIAPKCEYYLWVGFSDQKRELADRLRQMGTIIREWPNAIIFDLTRKP